MGNFAKIIDVYTGVQDNGLLDAEAQLSKDGIMVQRPVLGDTVLFRWTLYTAEDDSTAYALPAGAKFELVVSDRVNAGMPNVMAYAGEPF